jgi:uncharacterized membrane protein
MSRETSKRSLAKTLSWRFFALLITSLVVLLYTGSAAIALTIGGTEALVKMVLYFVHERVWARLRFGLADPIVAADTPLAPRPVGMSGAVPIPS